MSKQIIGRKKDIEDSIVTNCPTYTKFTCQAYKDREKKKKDIQRQLKIEIERRNE